MNPRCERVVPPNKHLRDKAVITDDCIEWDGVTNDSGYGIVRLNGKIAGSTFWRGNRKQWAHVLENKSP